MALRQNEELISVPTWGRPMSRFTSVPLSLIPEELPSSTPINLFT